MELREALSQISDIHRQMARGEVFRGYRSVTVGFSGMLALAAAAIQPLCMASTAEALERYLGLWIAVAAVSTTVAGLEMWWRAQATGSAMTRQMTRLAVQQFLPSLVVGALLTAAIYQYSRSVAWMLPGLWSLIFSLGIFASHRLVPRPFFWVGVYYVVCGIGCLRWGQGAYAFSPWQMAVSFGGGQLMSAWILYWKLERTYDAHSKG